MYSFILLFNPGQNMELPGRTSKRKNDNHNNHDPLHRRGQESQLPRLHAPGTHHRRELTRIPHE